jgi:hypothetical protein
MNHFNFILYMWSVSCSVLFNQVERYLSSHCLVDPRVGLNFMKKIKVFTPAWSRNLAHQSESIIFTNRLTQ